MSGSQDLIQLERAATPVPSVGQSKDLPFAQRSRRTTLMTRTFYFAILIALVGGCESQSHPLDSDTSVPDVVAEDTPNSGTSNVPNQEKQKFDHDLVVAMLTPNGANQLLKNMHDLQVPEALRALSEIMQNVENPEHLRKRAVTVIGRIGNDVRRQFAS